MIFFSIACSKKIKVKGHSAEYYFKNENLVKLCHAIEKNDTKQFESIIKTGVNLNSVGKKKSVTPLIWAIWLNKPDMVKALVENGADPNKQASITFEYPMKTAAIHNQFDIVLMLLELGADPLLKDAQGYNIAYEIELHYKLRSRSSQQFKNLLKVIDLLEKKGMKFNLGKDQK